MHVAVDCSATERALFSDLRPGEVRQALRGAVQPRARVKLAYTAKGRWRGWARVTLTNLEDADAVVAALDGAVLSASTDGAGGAACPLRLRASLGLGRRDGVLPFLPSRAVRELFQPV